jgi:hypothetical protein
MLKIGGLIMSTKKLNIYKTHVPWRIKKVIWIRYASGETNENIKKYFQLNADKFKDAPKSVDTISKVRHELDVLDGGIVAKLIQEVPNVKEFVLRQRPDLKETIQELVRPTVKEIVGGEGLNKTDNEPIINHKISLVAKNEQIPNITKHDERVFMASDAILNELTLMDFLDTLGREHAYRVSTCKIDAFVRFFYLLSNKYLSPTLAQSVLSLQSDLTKLFRFLVNHFFSYPDTQNETDLRLALRPELLEAIHDGDAEAEKKYNKFSKKLEDLIDCVKQTYSNYRKAIRDNLAV